MLLFINNKLKFPSIVCQLLIETIVPKIQSKMKIFDNFPEGFSMKLGCSKDVTGSSSQKNNWYIQSKFGRSKLLNMF